MERNLQIDIEQHIEVNEREGAITAGLVNRSDRIAFFV